MSGSDLFERIDSVERKLEIRRDRTARHLEEARADAERSVQTGMKWAPLLAAGALGAAAFRVGRHWRAPAGLTPQPPSERANGREAAGPGAAAAVAAIGGTLIRAAFTPQARELWRMWQASRDRSRRNGNGS